MVTYSPAHERTMRAFYNSLRENDRRRYAAVEAAKLGYGGIEYIAKVLDVDPKTIRRGQDDLDNLPEPSPEHIRQPGGGRKRKLDQDPKLDQDFQKVLVEHTAGSPTLETLIWTNLTKSEIVDLMQECGSFTSVHIVHQLLDLHGFHQRQAERKVPPFRHPDRNNQFETIARLKSEYLDSANPILSMDLKAREVLGNFFRSGTLWTRQPIRVFDKDLEEFEQGVALPHGLYDMKRNCGYIHIGTSHDTSEFACDCIGDWWERFGHAAYPEATSLLVLCDGSGSNPADTERTQANLFRTDLQGLVNQMGLEIRMAHYPPYASKYNPIEHRVFPHLSRVCRGVILHSVDLVVELMSRAKTATGLTVVVDLLDKVYETGRRAREAAVATMNLVRDAVLPRWNYRILPNM